jgi:hypothetical protein
MSQSKTETPAKQHATGLHLKSWQLDLKTKSLYGESEMSALWHSGLGIDER